MITINNYITEKLKINKDINISDNIKNIVYKIFHCTGLKIGAWPDAEESLKKWAEENKIKELESYITKEYYQGYWGSNDSSTIKYFDHIDDEHQKVIERYLKKRGKKIYNDEENGFWFTAGELEGDGLAFYDDGNGYGDDYGPLCVFWPKNKVI